MRTLQEVYDGTPGKRAGCLQIGVRLVDHLGSECVVTGFGRESCRVETLCNGFTFGKAFIGVRGLSSDEWAREFTGTDGWKVQLDNGQWIDLAEFFRETPAIPPSTIGVGTWLKIRDCGGLDHVGQVARFGSKTVAVWLPNTANIWPSSYGPYGAVVSSIGSLSYSEADALTYASKSVHVLAPSEAVAELAKVIK